MRYLKYLLFVLVGCSTLASAGTEAVTYVLTGSRDFSFSTLVSTTTSGGTVFKIPMSELNTFHQTFGSQIYNMFRQDVAIKQIPTTILHSYQQIKYQDHTYDWTKCTNIVSSEYLTIQCPKDALQASSS
jgi:hypothetical protein